MAERKGEGQKNCEKKRGKKKGSYNCTKYDKDLKTNTLVDYMRSEDVNRELP